MGNVLSAGEGQAPARQAALAAGLPNSIECLTINKVCGSALKAVGLAANSIWLEENEIVVAGGMESMSQAPFLVRGRSGELRFGHKNLVDALLHDGLWDAYEDEVDPTNAMMQDWYTAVDERVHHWSR